jgi:hypothetical protein
LEDWDYAVFADTQAEPDAVYHHLEWLKGRGRAPIITASAGSLGDNVKRGVNVNGGRFVSIPAYTLLPGGITITRRQCTKEYKLRVVEKAIREILSVPYRARVPSGVFVQQGFGITLDEMGRAARIVRNWKTKWSTPIFPLLDRRMNRASCVAWLRTHVPHEVPRSACVFCPYRSDREWRHLRDSDPQGWARALEVDDALRVPDNIVNRKMAAERFVHRSCVPLRLAPIDESDDGLLAFAAECSGGCGL